ncbi:MAG: anti-sigma factor family protein [bacterium]
MSCPTMNNELEILVDYCAGRLNAGAAAELRTHIDSCPACSRFAAEQQAAWNALDAFEAPPVSAGFDRRLWERIEREKRRRAWWQGWWPAALGRPALAFALALVFVVGAVRLSLTRPEPPDTLMALDADRIESALEDIDMLLQLAQLTDYGEEL